MWFKTSTDTSNLTAQTPAVVRAKSKYNRRAGDPVTTPQPRFAVVHPDSSELDFINKDFHYWKDSPLVPEENQPILDLFTNPTEFMSAFRKETYNLVACSVDFGPREIQVWKMADLLLGNRFSSDLIIIAVSDNDKVTDSKCMLPCPLIFSNLYDMWQMYKERPSENHFRILIRATEYDYGKDL